MSLPLDYFPEVRDEIDAAYDWYERKRPGLGDDFLALCRDLLGRIKENPLMYGEVFRDVRAAPMRRFPYVVYYRAEEKRTVVIALQHGHRNPARWRARARRGKQP